MRLCLIGNSHLACIQLAWIEMQRELPHLRPVSFGAPRTEWTADLQFAGDRFRAGSPWLAEQLRATSGGLDEIVLASYDAFAVVGLGFDPMKVVLQAASRHGSLDARVLRADVMNALGLSPAVAISRHIRAAGYPMVLVPHPCLLVRWRRSKRKLAGWLAGLPDGSSRLLARIGTECASDAAAAAGLEVLWQPASTLVDDFFTDDRFAQRAAEPSGEDFAHTSGAYGEIVLRGLLARLQPAAERLQTT